MTTLLEACLLGGTKSSAMILASQRAKRCCVFSVKCLMLCVMCYVLCVVCCILCILCMVLCDMCYVFCNFDDENLVLNVKC